MKRCTLFALAIALALLVGCGMPASLRKQIAEEHRLLDEAHTALVTEDKRLQKDLTTHPDLFQNAAEPMHWKEQIVTAKTGLAQADKIDTELARMARENRRRDRDRAADLIYRSKRIREDALAPAHSARAAAQKWVSFKNDLPHHLAEMESAYNESHDQSNKLSTTLERAERDWSPKKQALSSRYAAVLDVSKRADETWQQSAQARAAARAGKAGGGETVALIEASDALTQDAAAFGNQSSELRNLCDQLYTSWDKILIDLDDRNGAHRERIKIVRSHINDVETHESETSSSEQWVDVSQPAFHAVQDDLGMAIAHKDAGLFDSEATNTPQPAGFAYIAPEGVGQNQYGYWQVDHGHSIWTWLPQYLILRELLWNHAYRPVVLDEYRGYRTAQTVGKTYYGTTPATSTPKYGTHGSFTRTTYASSRYVQSGSFKASGYASHRVSSAPSQAPRSTPHVSERGGGKRFGGSNPGRGFGRSPGRSFGRGFGRR